MHHPHGLLAQKIPATSSLSQMQQGLHSNDQP